MDDNFTPEEIEMFETLDLIFEREKESIFSAFKMHNIILSEREENLVKRSFYMGAVYVIQASVFSPKV